MTRTRVLLNNRSIIPPTGRGVKKSVADKLKVVEWAAVAKVASRGPKEASNGRYMRLST